MMRVPCLLLCSAVLFLAPLMALAGGGFKQFPASGGLQFEFRDNINSPIYSWPRTLLTYPVDFSAAKVRPDQLGLTDAVSGRPVPMQLSDQRSNDDGTLASASVSFFSDLPPGAVRRFLLSDSPTNAKPDRSVTATQQGDVIEVNAGTFKIRLPASRAVRSGQTVPGPIIAIDRGRGWMGDSQLLSPTKPVQRVQTDEVATGDLFRTFRITYTFTGGGTYVAVVRAVLDYPFVDLREETTGIEPADKVLVEQTWTHFAPTMRFAANGWECGPDGRRIDDPVMTGGSREEPHWTPLDYVEDPARKMVYHLASFQGNAPRDAVPVMSFWDSRPGGQELSLFVPDTLDWNDNQYMIWQPTTRLQVRFRYDAGQLICTWPIVSGTRRTGLAVYDAEQGVRNVEATRKVFMEQVADKRSYKFQGAFYRGVNAVPLRYGQLLRSWYGGLDLNRVKDWVLEYPASARRAPHPFETDGKGSADALEKLVFNSAVMIYPLGTNLMSMNIDHRIIRPIVEQYLRVGSQLTPEQRRRVDAVLLLSAYVNSGEDLAPVRTCLTGTPNMSADGFSVPTEISVLFPDHPMGAAWRDQFEKTMELMACFYTRPAVPAWGAAGGRWAESFGIYNWAYLAPTLAAQTAGTLTDGRNRIANPWMAMRGRWIVDSLTAPVFNPDPYERQKGQVPASQPADWTAGDPLDVARGFERQYPAHGAHGTGTGQSIPSDMVPVLGTYLMRYDPITAEHLLWAGHQGAPGAHAEGNGTVWGDWEVARLAGNPGTNPHLRSAKYTGQGFILRAGVGTPEEVSVHLQQIDRGPNYRWGNNGEGSSGTIYFNAGGKVWSGHERENTGDHANDDSTGNTNFAAVSRGAYRTIGANVLDQPLIDLGFAQFAQIDARQGTGAYSWPAMRSRSVMLVGTDYFVLADDAKGQTRFTWFTARDLPFPKLVFLQPLGVRTDAISMVTTQMSKGILRDANGPMVTLVSHKRDGVEMEEMVSKPHPVLAEEGIQQYAKARGNKLPDGAYRVKTPGSRDLVVRALTPIVYRAGDQSFRGEAGVIRTRNDGTTDMALLRGTEVAAAGVRLVLPKGNQVGISASFKDPSEMSGRFVAGASAVLRLTTTASETAATHKFYIDGVPQVLTANDKTFQIQLPVGTHDWEWTARLPRPLAPTIQRTENVAGGAAVYFSTVAGAETYQLELSRDGGSTWTAAGEKKASSPIEVSGLPDGQKVHVRVVACNADRASVPSREYPIYVSADAPLPPDGLWLQLSEDRVHLTWGQVLGVSNYRLYRRVQGTSDWRKVYEGLANSYTDTEAKGVRSATRYPGTDGQAPQTDAPAQVFEYAVAAVNGNGEGEKSYVADTDPSGWRNWWPQDEPRQFKRQTGYWLPPYVDPDTTPPLRYPQPAAPSSN